MKRKREDNASAEESPAKKVATDTPDYDTQTQPKGALINIISKDATKHIDWLVKVFDAKVTMKFPYKEDPAKIIHAALDFNGGELYIGDNILAKGAVVEPPSNPSGYALFHLNVDNSDAVWKKALDAGATVHLEISDTFWGAHYGVFKDPFGCFWAVSHQLPPKKTEEKKEASSA
eukprot:TRINITY_DN1072_c0_g1_i1.p1 TRINITY_DN1072_c0_g1~~TRINITY_DN1072_c0_g1_i1.p1  ORF type:complete len:175 (+),score=41.52 TRINITY_DN1072_c0_g1_i1:52-576(+)